MARTFDEIYEDALMLDGEVRGALADAIWESCLTDEEREIQNEWIAESERRLEEMRTGKVKGIPYEKVMTDVRAKLIPYEDVLRELGVD